MKHDNSLFMLNCECSCGIIAFRYYDNNNLVIEEQEELDDSECCMGIEYFPCANGDKIFSWYNFKERIKAAWKILIGKHYCVYDIILNKKDFEEFRKWLNLK